MASIIKTLVNVSCCAMMAIGIQSVHAEPATQGGNSQPIVITPDALNWHAFDDFPKGAEAAVLAGDPRKPEPFMLRIKIPAGYKVPPSWQTVKIFVTVLSGQYSIGVGDTFNARNGKTLPSAGSIVIPANTHLYFWSKKGAVVEVHGVGPWEIHYLDPANDPRHK